MLTVNVLIERVSDDLSSTPFAVHYEKIRIRLRETATSSVKIHSWTAKKRTFAHKSDSITIFAF